MTKMNMSLMQLALAFGAFALITADKVPVLMWSQSRPLSDLPQAFAGNSIESDTFLHKYLQPLTSKTGNNVVAFIQDKLHMEDFTKYADVYNPFSDGGAFKNIKSLMDEQFSVNLPAVHSPKTVIDTLMKEFQGRVHKISSPEHVNGLKMEKDKSYLILVHLPATSQDKNEERAISKNDEKVGEITKALDKRSIKYTAVFTGEQSERTSQSAFKGRHLLATSDNITGIFVNASEGRMFFYSRNIQVTFVQRVKVDAKPETRKYTTIDFQTEEGTYNWNGSFSTNDTAFFRLDASEAKENKTGNTFNVTFRFDVLKLPDRWSATNFSLFITNTTDGNNNMIIDNQPMSLSNAEMLLPPYFSYHCSNITLFASNMTEQNKEYAVLRFEGIQFQPFGIQDDRFSEAWDCVGFFTTPIWMGLFPVGIFIVILFFGMYMITQLSTMDRFDDPKGKTITVNVNE